jgi:hypothetical protein
MDNQHRKISGYRELTQADIDLMNEIKAAGTRLEALLHKIDLYVGAQYEATPDGDDDEDSERLALSQPRRWLSIARTNLQQGLMAATRAVAQPTFF